MAQPSNVSFSKRRRIVRALRRAQRRRRVIAEGIRLVFGGFLSAGILMAAVVVGIALWFSQRMAPHQPPSVPSQLSDWSQMSRAVARRDIKLCDRISASATLWDDKDYPAPTLREECRSRILGMTQSIETQQIQPSQRVKDPLSPRLPVLTTEQALNRIEQTTPSRPAAKEFPKQRELPKPELQNPAQNKRDNW